MEHFVLCQVFWHILFHNINMNKFSERLNLLRTENNLTRSQLAEKLSVSVRLISYWENGKRECCFDMLIKLSKIFNCTVDYLLGNSEY